MESLLGWFQVGFNDDPNHEYTFNVRVRGTILPDIPNPQESASLFYRWLGKPDLHHVQFIRHDGWAGQIRERQAGPQETTEEPIGWFEVGVGRSVEVYQVHPNLIVPEIEVASTTFWDASRFYRTLGDPELRYVRFMQRMFPGDTTGRNIKHAPWASGRRR